MHVLVTRPHPAAGRTASRLAARGHVAIVAPTLAVAPSGEAMPDGEFDALVLTSVNALVAFIDPPEHLPVLTVGDRTAEAARDAGFHDVRSAVGDRQALALLAQETLPPGQRLLLVAGRDRKDDLAELLAHAGHEPVIWTAYLAEAKPVLPPAAKAALATGPLDALLHYSRRSATIGLGLARQAGLEAAFLSGLHACLSEDVAAPLRSAGAKRLVVAATPDEDSLFEALEVGIGVR
jgi:uroporphyrinogen-III synthase